MTSAKPHIVFAWEAGANYGHASNIAEVAHAIGDRARMTVIAKDTVSFRQIAPDAPVALLPAPRALPQPPPAPQDLGVSFSDDLRHLGWANESELFALTESWNNLFQLTKPDLIAFQAAPAGLLAAHGLEAKTAMFGYGYDLPPRTAPLPPFIHWNPKTKDGLAEKEAAVLAVANKALAKLGRPPVERFADLLATDAYLIGCFPEIDPYAPRDQFEQAKPAYYGQLATTDTGIDLKWRDDGKHRLFAYLSAAKAQTKTALEALSGLGPEWDCIASVPGLPAAIREAATRPHLRLADGPVKLDGILKDCQVCLSHGGAGTAAAFIANGVPQVCLPTQVEQVMAARALAQNRLSIGLVGDFKAKDVQDAVTRVANLPEMRAHARSVAKRLKRDNLLNPATRIAAELMRLI